MSEQPVPVTPEELADTFLEKYKLYEIGQLPQGGEIFSDRQISAIVNTIQADYDGMLSFFAAVQTIIVAKILDERGEDNHKEVAMCLIQYNNCITGFWIPTLHIALAPPETQAMMREQYEKYVALKRVRDNVDPFENLDFKMPNPFQDGDPDKS